MDKQIILENVANKDYEQPEWIIILKRLYDEAIKLKKENNETTD